MTIAALIILLPLPKKRGRGYEKFLFVKLSQNSGYPGIPRNFGLDFAKGKYIYFLDSDDFLDATALEDFYKVAEKFNADVVHSEKCFVYEEVDGELKDTVGSPQTGEFVENPTLETFDIGERVSDFVNKRYIWWGCNKLFRREFLMKNNIKFYNIRTFEDFIFAFQCIVCAKNYVRVPLCNYHYRIRKDSLSHKGTNITKIMYTFMEVVNTLDNFMAGKNFFLENPKYRYAVLDFYIQERLDVLSKDLFITSSLDPAELYDFLCRDIFSINPPKNIPLISYLFTSMNIYKLLVNQQAAEIAQLKKILQSK